MLHAQIAALVLAATTLATAGCGGSSKTGSTGASTGPAAASTTAASTTTKLAAGKPLTRAELIAKADAICKQFNAQRKLVKFRSTADYVRLLPVMAGYEATVHAKLGNLVPPASIANEWQQIVGGFQQMANASAEVAEDVRTHNYVAARSLLASFQHVVSQTDPVAKRIGFKDCLH